MPTSPLPYVLDWIHPEANSETKIWMKMASWGRLSKGAGQESEGRGQESEDVGVGESEDVEAGRKQSR